MKKVLLILLSIITVFTLCSCSQRNDILGKYVSESGKYTVEFKENNICIWYQEILDTETFFEGTYKKDGEKYKLLIKGDGFFTTNTSFLIGGNRLGVADNGGGKSLSLFSADYSVHCKLTLNNGVLVFDVSATPEYLYDKGDKYNDNRAEGGKL